MERLARIEAPGIDSLDPRLLRRFVSEQGVWRIEVMPRSGTGQLSFAAAVRRAVPEAAGEPHGLPVAQRDHPPRNHAGA